MDKIWVKHYEPGVRPHLDYPDAPLFSFLDRSASKYPNRKALIFGAVAHALPGQPLFDGSMTYRELSALVNRMANALASLGVKKGDRVAVYLPNSPQFVISYYAVLKLGAYVVPTNPIYVPRELEHQLCDSDAGTLITLSQFYPRFQQVRAHTNVKNVIVTNVKEYFPPILKTLFTLALEKKEGHRVTLDSGDHWFQDLLKQATETPPQVEVKPEDTAILLYTGGTTGVPKGAELTHRNLVANAMQVREWFTNAHEAEETFLTALPLFHSYTMTTCMNMGIYLAGTLILIPNPRDLEHLLKSTDKHHPTVFPAVPTLYVAINNYPDIGKHNLRSIKACISGAAGLPVEVQTQFIKLSGGSLVEGYGLSEASPVTHANPLMGENRIGTIGLPLPDTDVRLVDVETGAHDCGVGESGELWVRGPQVMKRYWNKPDETARQLREGWLRTGDVAVMDQDGYFKIVDRVKDLIISGGFNVYPREIEDVLYQHPAVLEAAAAGVPDAYRGESVKAFIVLKPGMQATADEVIAFCREHLAPFKVPRQVEFRDSLPKTMIGKILRRELVAQEKQQSKPV
ncbi:MAG: long-chain fatty acid--CoA ligase [Anaerolineae bacterium]